MRGARDIEAAGDVHVDDLGKVRRGEIHRLADTKDTSGADDVVEAAEAPGRGGDVRFDGGVVAYVEPGSTPVDRHLRALLGRELRDRLADPVRAADDVHPRAVQ